MASANPSPIISGAFAQFIATPQNSHLFISETNIEFKDQIVRCLNKLYEMYLQFNVNGVKPGTLFVLRQLPAALLVALSADAQPLYRNSISRSNQYQKFSRLMSTHIDHPGMSSVFHIQAGQSFKDNIFELTSAIEQIYEYVMHGVNGGSPQKFIDLLNAEPPVACLNNAISKLLEIATTQANEDNMEAVSDLTEDICKLFRISPPKVYEKIFKYWSDKYFLNPGMFGFAVLKRKYPNITEKEFKYYLDKYVTQYVTQYADHFTIDCSMINSNMGMGGRRRMKRRSTKKSCRTKKTRRNRRYSRHK
jgi:hypothetical protein